MTKQQYIEHCRSILSAEVDQPFDEDFDTWVARHSDNRKWFALIFDVKGRPAVNLKCDPMEADFLRSVYEGVTPAYHMNKTHWNTVYFDSDVPDEELVRMTEASFALTKTKKKGK
ncbi:MAG: MmcQ/YjbR family DNA-binding protein [Ruminococcaceae bacterium]|nr:MmcQ/YjbR family DNA-binding protein [Oscillospiraceae bacterium]